MSFNENAHQPFSSPRAHDRAVSDAQMPSVAVSESTHVRWDDAGSSDRVPANAPHAARARAAMSHAHAASTSRTPASHDRVSPPRPASPTPRAERQKDTTVDRTSTGKTKSRDDVVVEQETDAEKIARYYGAKLFTQQKRKRKRLVAKEEDSAEPIWTPDSDTRLGRIFLLRVDRDGNPRTKGVDELEFARDRYPLGWVRLISTQHELATERKIPSGVYSACRTEAKTLETANRVLKRQKKIVFYESLDLRYLESLNDVKYLDLDRFPHPAGAREKRKENAVALKKRNRIGSGGRADLIDLAVAADLDLSRRECRVSPALAPGSPERSRTPRASARTREGTDEGSERTRAAAAAAAAAAKPAPPIPEGTPTFVGEWKTGSVVSALGEATDARTTEIRALCEEIRRVREVLLEEREARRTKETRLKKVLSTFQGFFFSFFEEVSVFFDDEKKT
jgi:hypothetical protein